MSAAAPAFSNLLANYTLDSAGTFTTGLFYSFEGATPGVTPGVTLATPLAITSNTIGLTFAYQGTTNGTTYASVNSLTSIITAGTPATVGSNVFDGYYRNANSETNGNFTSTLRSLGLTNQSVAVRVYGNLAATGTAAPEPSSLAILSGGLGLLGVRLRRRKNRA